MPDLSNADQVEARLRSWETTDAVGRLWGKDHTLWSADPQPEIADRLGWLTLPTTMQPAVDDIIEFADEIKAEGAAHVVLLGMGGSSLAPEVFQRTFGNGPGYPKLLVLDSTHPGAVAAIDAEIDPAQTLFVVASKSGTTIEPLSFMAYFWDRVAAVTNDPGRRFIAITDPGSSLVDLAAERGFRRVFEAIPDVGGRYSALTHFGLVPAALIGADIAAILRQAAEMAAAIASGDTSALALGAALGELALAGRDKATFVMSPSLQALPVWAEQLIAESTGKDGVGIVPIADEPLGPPDAYGSDRFFVYLSLDGEEDGSQASAIDALEAAGHPVARIAVAGLEHLGAEMFRQEVATAMAGAVLGIHPFNQPDVQMAKELARKAMDGTLNAGTIPETPADDATALTDAVSRLLDSVDAGDYVGIQAFISPSADNESRLARVRQAIRDRLHVATTVGLGPRFLHSTGQLHKGGADNGVFIQIVDHAAPDVAVPGTDYTFARLVAGQADGDYQALADAGRRVIRICLGDDEAGGLAALLSAVST